MYIGSDSIQIKHKNNILFLLGMYIGSDSIQIKHKNNILFLAGYVYW